MVLMRIASTEGREWVGWTSSWTSAFLGLAEEGTRFVLVFFRLCTRSKGPFFSSFLFLSAVVCSCLCKLFFLLCVPCCLAHFSFTTVLTSSPDCVALPTALLRCVELPRMSSRVLSAFSGTTLIPGLSIVRAKKTHVGLCGLGHGQEQSAGAQNMRNRSQKTVL